MILEAAMTTDYRAIIIAEQQHRDALRADWVKAGMSPQAAAADAQTWANLALWVEDKTLVTPAGPSGPAPPAAPPARP